MNISPGHLTPMSISTHPPYPAHLPPKHPGGAAGERKARRHGGPTGLHYFCLGLIMVQMLSLGLQGLPDLMTEK